MLYKSLFNINIHHGYFLDKGEEKYLKVANDDTEMSDEDKEYSLKEYNVSDYLKITPSGYTKTQFRNYRIMTRPQKSGFRVLVDTMERTIADVKKYEPVIPLDDDIYLTFEIKATDEYFYNYSELFDVSDYKMYLFTNVEPANQDAEFENLFENNGGHIDSRFLLKEDETRELLKTIALEDQSFMSVQNGMASLGNNIRLIENHADLTNDQKDTEIEALLNATIKQKKKRQTIGYVRLKIKGDAADRHLLEYSADKQYVINTTPEFTISFINRKTFWSYIVQSEDKTFTTTNKKWLSKNGYTEIIGIATDDDPSDFDPAPVKSYQFPNPTVEIIKKEDNKYYSEIFI